MARIFPFGQLNNLMRVAYHNCTFEQSTCKFNCSTLGVKDLDSTFDATGQLQGAGP